MLKLLALHFAVFLPVCSNNAVLYFLGFTYAQFVIFARLWCSNYNFDTFLTYETTSSNQQRGHFSCSNPRIVRLTYLCNKVCLFNKHCHRLQVSNLSACFVYKDCFSYLPRISNFHSAIVHLVS